MRIHGRKAVSIAVGLHGGHGLHVAKRGVTIGSIGVGHGCCHVVEVGIGLCAAWLAVLLQVGLGILKVTGTRRITATNRALLEMALQDVTARESVLAKVALVRALARVCCCEQLNMTRRGTNLRRRRWRFRCFR